ncbi:MAG TPA: hypothetical protein VKT72_18445 [Candidatus Baltobacteraceae bacterium]|nr:hypothetical protein [Candidatus Baltobacteraceae bacterium]
MRIDLRVPLGLLFSGLGAIMLAYGMTSNQAMYQRSLGINVNLWWGIVELLFGAVTALFGYVAMRRRT